MARGKPDYYRSSVIEGKYGSDFIPVVVDSTGQMFIALTGQQIAVNNHPSDYFKEDETIGSITANVTVDQENSDRVLKGTEGVNKRYIAVDATGIILARLKGAEGATLRDVAVDSSGILLSRLKGAFEGALKDISVDTDGKIIGVLQGDDSGTKRTLFVDTNGKMVARVQGVGGGLEPLFTVDDGGDEDLISDWIKNQDGLDPENLEDFGKEGQHSMKLGIDASRSIQDYGLWDKSVEIGDMHQFKNMRLYIWIYFQTIDYLRTSSYAVKYHLGNDISNNYNWRIVKTELVDGWNLIEIALASPGEALGTIDWTDIKFQRLIIYTLPDNTDDFYVVLDLIVVVKPNPVTGNLIDVATDKDGLMLSKMTGSYGELHKPVSVDRFGNMRVNISEQGEFTQVSNFYRSGLQIATDSRDHPGIETYTLLDVSTRGVVMGGNCIHTGVASHQTCVVQIEIDGYVLSANSFYSLDYYNLIQPWNVIPHLTKYDDTNFVYVVCFPHGLVFNTSLKITIDEVVGVISATFLKLLYALF